MMKKLAVIASGLLLGSVTLKAEEPKLGPDAEFFRGLQKLEQNYIKAMREKAEKAASVQIYRISSKGEALDIFSDGEIKGFIKITRGGNGNSYNILKSGKPVKEATGIKAWANAVLPAEEQPFAMCIPDYGFGVRFIDQDGHTIYSTRICLKCKSTEVSYPKYASRLGFDPKVVKKLIDASGLSPDN